MTLLEMIQRIQDLERRVANMIRHAPAQEVDPAKQTVRLSLAPEGDPEMLSPPIPYAQVAGPTESGLKIHAPPMERQNMTVFAPSGDLRQAVAVPMIWSNDAPSPGQTRDPVRTYGQVRVDLTATSIKATIGDAKLTLTGLAEVIAGRRHQMSDGSVRQPFEVAGRRHARRGGCGSPTRRPHAASLETP